MELILSGYGKEPQKTIAQYTVQEGKPPVIRWQDCIENASFLCQGDGCLFTVTEAEEYAAVYLYRQSDEGFRLMDHKALAGGALCHIAYSAKNKALFGACYETGTIFSVRVEQDRFGELLYQEVQQGPDDTALTRAHCVLLNREESELLTVNIALDLIIIYEINKGFLLRTDSFRLPEGSGPRHAVFSSDEKLLYVITEYTNEILVYDYAGNMRLLQRISTLAEDFTGRSNCSALCFSRDGAYLYAANRGADTVTVFKAGESGLLERAGEYACGGKHPRHMLVTRDGKQLVVCNQYSDNAAVFCLDTASGMLKEMAASIEFKTPGGVLEL